MIRARQGVRWSLIGVGGLLALVVLLRVGLGIYLGTAAGKGFVGRKISAQIGMPVEVTRVRVGLMTSTIGLKVSDPAAPEASKSEVLAVDNASADISLFGIAAGRIAPKNVNLRGLNLTLHVSSDGKVVTTLPKVPESSSSGGSLPTITLTEGRLTISQDGRPPFALQNLNATVTPTGDRVTLDGTVDDPAWSKWVLKGDIAKDGSAGEVRLETQDGPLTMDRLESVPFVPSTVWKSVRADGRGAVAVRLWADATQDVHYSVDIRPNAATLTLPDASATLSKVTGQISVTGAKVKLVGTKAELADGTLSVDGAADFGPEPTVVTLKATAAGLDLKKLPTEWGLPRDIDGKLNGTADLGLKVYSDGRLVPTGGGEGAITDVTVRLPKGTLKSDDIPIHLRAAGNQLEFHRMPKGTGARPVNTPVRTAARQEKKPADPPPPKKEAAKSSDPVLDATVRFRDINIAELLEKLDVKLNYKLGGKVTAEATISVPVTGAASRASYKFTGKISSPALTLEGLTIRDLSANMTYLNGKFTLSELAGKIDQPGKTGEAAGSFKGTVDAAIDPPGDVSAALTIDRIPVGEVLKALPGFALDVKGTASGKVTMKAPYETLSEPASWSGSGDVSSSQLVVEGRSAKDIKLAAVVEKGTVTLSEAKVSLEGIPIIAEGTLGLSGKYPFSATVKTSGTNVTDLRKLIPEAELPAPIEGVLETDTKLTGTITPLTYTANGSITASKLTLAKSSANQIALKWALTPEKVTITDLKADAFGGSLTGSADIPFAADKAGAFSVQFKDLDSGAATELVPDFPVKITGKVSGKVAGTIPPAKEGQSRVGALDIDLSAPKLTVQGIPAERLAGKAALKAGAVEYELEGKTLGGSFEIKGRYPGQKKDEKTPIGKRDRGSFRLTGVDLSRLAGGLGFDALRPLGGRLDVTFDFENDLSAGSGRITLTRLVWGGATVSQEVIGLLVLRDGVIQLSDVSGRVAGGDLRARGSVRLEQTQRNFFTLALTGADAKKLLAPFGADTRDLIDGPVSVVVSARLGGETRGSGTISLPRGSVSGVQVTDLRVPFTFASAAGGYGRFAIREASVNAGSGRAQAELTLDWGSEVRVGGQVRFVDVPIRSVAPSLGENALFGNGRVTGRFDLKGSRVRSIDDVSGTLLATLSNASVKEIPILQQVTPFLNTTGLAKPFQSGDVRGSLTNGVFRVERLALANPSAQLFAEGTITTSGRIDLNVVAHTGNIGPDVRGLRLFGLRLPAFGPVPITLIRDVSDFLSNRTVRLSITGQTSNPVVRVNVGALLTEQAIRFFLSRYVLPAEAAGALGLGTGIGSMSNR